MIPAAPAVGLHGYKFSIIIVVQILVVFVLVVSRLLSGSFSIHCYLNLLFLDSIVLTVNKMLFHADNM
jgi:hypothetical protein